MNEYGCKTCGFNTNNFWIIDAHRILNPTHNIIHRLMHDVSAQDVKQLLQRSELQAVTVASKTLL